MRPDGTGVERLTDDPAYDDQAAFSPDGKQIVFVTTRAGGTVDLWILDPETRKAKPLTSRARWRLPAGVVSGWKLDRFLFRSREHVADGKRPLGTPAPAWSPDGESSYSRARGWGLKTKRCTR